MTYKVNKKMILEEASSPSTAKKVTTGTLAGGAVAAKTGALGGLGKLAAGGLGKAALVKGAMLAGKSGGIYVNPNEQNRLKSALVSGGTSALGTAAINGVGAALGSGVPLGAIGIGAAGAGLTGAAAGGALSGGRDTFVKSSILPAAIVAGSSIPMNYAFEHLGYPNIEVDPTASAAITGGLGGAAWLGRNLGKKKEII